MNRSEFDRLKQSILAHLRVKVRMSKLQIATTLGLTNTVEDGEVRIRRVVNKLLESLADDGEIQVIEPSAIRSTAYYVLSDYQPQKLKSSVSPEKASYRSYVDLSLKGTWQQPIKSVPQEWADEPKQPSFQIRVKPMTEPQPNAIDKHLAQHLPAQKLTPQRKAELSREKLEAALTDLIAEGKPFNLTALCQRAGLSDGLVYDAKFADIKQRAQQAIAEIKGKSATEPVKVTDLKPTVELERQITELEQRNRELRQQLTEAQSKPGQDAYLKGLRADEQDWRVTLQRIEAEMAELEQDRKAAIANLYAVQRLLATKTGEEPALEMQIVVSANGNGNGHKAGVA